MIEFLAGLIPALPILAAAVIGAGYMNRHGRGEKAEKWTARVAMWAIGLSLSTLIAIDLYSLINGSPGQLQLGQWFKSGLITVDINFTLDTLGLVMATLVATLCLLTTKFSINYLHREDGFQRFMIISLFSGAMLLIVLAGNAVLAFVGWELAGVSSYLLIAYAYDRNTATTTQTGLANQLAPHAGLFKHQPRRTRTIKSVAVQQALDLRPRERFIAVCFALIILFLGLYPSSVLDLTKTSSTAWVEKLNPSTVK